MENEIQTPLPYQDVAHLINLRLMLQQIDTSEEITKAAQSLDAIIATKISNITQETK